MLAFGEDDRERALEGTGDPFDGAMKAALASMFSTPMKRMS